MSGCRAMRPGAYERFPRGSLSVAERDRVVVADPLPQGDGAAHLGPADEVALVEAFGLEADRTDQVAVAGADVALHERGQRRAARARHPGGDAGQGQPDGLLGEEHKRVAALLGRSDRDQMGHCDLLRVLEPRRQADDRFASHATHRPRQCSTTVRAARIVRPTVLVSQAWMTRRRGCRVDRARTCLLYTSDAADEEDSVDLG